MKTRRNSVALVVGMLILAVFAGTGRGQQPEYTAMHNPLSLEMASMVQSGQRAASGQALLMRGQNEESAAPAECAGACAEQPCCQEDLRCEETRCGSCCGGCGLPKWRIYGDFLYLRPRSAEVVYAVPFNGPDTPQGDVPIQVGRIAAVDPDYEPAFRVGFDHIVSDCGSIGVEYAQLDSSTSDSLTVDAPIVIRSTVIHPSTVDAATDWLSAEANYDIRYKLVNLDYRRVFLCGDRHHLDWLIGACYGHLEQEFRSTFSDLEIETINTDVNFDGGGIRLGLEGERQAACSGFLVYGRASASFFAGQFRARYFQGSVSDPEIVEADWAAGRIVPKLDLELGLGWASCNGCLRLTGGYMVSAWYNTVRTADYISAVQRNDFGGLNDAMTFDGLVVRGELRY
jgi:hypothetical protein